MAMLARFEEPAETGERRGSARLALRLDVEDRRGPNGAGRVMIHDLSLTGVLIETSTPLAPSETFEVDLPQVGKIETTVVWNSGEFYGCQFKEPISTAALSAALLQSPPLDAPPVSPTLAADLVAELRSINEQVEKIASEVERAVGRLASKSDDEA
jgi:PilZ domain